MYGVFVVFQTIRIDYYERLSTLLLTTGFAACLHRALVLTPYTGPKDLPDPKDPSRSIT